MERNANGPSREAWAEYDSAAEWCARRGIKAQFGEPLPEMLSSTCRLLIDEDPEAFEERVRGFAYALARARTDARSSTPEVAPQ